MINLLSSILIDHRITFGIISDLYNIVEYAVCAVLHRAGVLVKFSFILINPSENRLSRGLIHLIYRVSH